MAQDRKPVRQSHIQYALLRRYVQLAYMTQVVRELNDPEIAAQYGFTPIEVSYDWFARKLRRLERKKPEVIDAIREKWLDGLLEEPLTDARYCLHRLHLLVTNPDTAPQNIIQAIKAARDIVGHHDADKVATKESGKVNISLHEEVKEFFKEKEEDENEKK